MDYIQWAQLFGRTTEDNAVRDALAAAGIRKPPVVPKDETDTRVELHEGMMLVFTDEALFPEEVDVGEGNGVLTELVLRLQGPAGSVYMGSLPFKLKRDESQAALRVRLGDPIDENERFRWDEWELDGLVLNVTYAQDLCSLESISVRLPRPG